MMRWKVTNKHYLYLAAPVMACGLFLFLVPMGFSALPYMVASVCGVGGAVLIGFGVFMALPGIELADPQENAFCTDCGSAFTPMKKEDGFSKKTGKQQYTTTWQCPKARPNRWTEDGRCGGYTPVSNYAGIAAQISASMAHRTQFEPGCFVHATVQLGCIVCRSNLVETGALTHEEAEALK